MYNASLNFTTKKLDFQVTFFEVAYRDILALYESGLFGNHNSLNIRQSQFLILKATRFINKKK